MDRLISLKAAIDTIAKLPAIHGSEGSWVNMGEAIEKLKSMPSAQLEPCEDAVSRQAVQEMVDRIGDMYPYRQIGNRDSYSQYNEAWTDAINRVDAELNSLPSAQPEHNPDDERKIADLHKMVNYLLSRLDQRWIPCSERLPDVAQRVLLSGHGQVMVGMLHSFGKYSLEPTGILYVYPKDDIEAWMPLPEPYREEGGE